MGMVIFGPNGEIASIANGRVYIPGSSIAYIENEHNTLTVYLRPPLPQRVDRGGSGEIDSLQIAWKDGGEDIWKALTQTTD